MNIEDYLREYFPGVELVPSLYFQWDIAIHFSLGEGLYQFDENGRLHLERFNQVYKQTKTIFDELFSQEDDLILVTNVYVQRAKQQTRRLKVYQPNVRDKNILRHLRLETYPYPFEVAESDDFYEMQQFSLTCKVKDIRVEGILKAAIHEDFPPLKPRFGFNQIHYPDVFFVNLTKGIIFFVYDDRGCEVLALTPDKLRPLYEKYSDWVGDMGFS